MDTLFHALVLQPASDRAALLARIEGALDKVNAQLGTTFTHDGADTSDGVTYTVWTDDPDGSTETSWIRLTDDERSLVLEINATTPAILASARDALSTTLPVMKQIDQAPRPF